MIPGSNLLQSALTVISPQPFEYIQFIGRLNNSIGIDVPVYEEPITQSGSIQAVPRTLVQHLGLDWKKNYIQIYATSTITGIERGSSGDRVTFAGKTFQVLEENDWRPMDDWVGVMCVEIGT